MSGAEAASSGHNPAVDLRYWSRVGSLLLTHPLETLERVRQRTEMWRYASNGSVDYGPDPEWEGKLRRRLGELEADDDGRWYELLGTLERDLPNFPHGHDADVALAHSIWRIVSCTQAAKVVETGVARGVTSRAALDALEASGGGRLWSIDLPPLLSGFHGSVGAAVPEQLRHRWTYVRGSSRYELGRLLREIEPIDVFVQDSLGTPPTVLHELSLALEALRPGGWIIVNGIDRSDALARFVEAHPRLEPIIAPGAPKSAYGSDRVIGGQFALVPKPGVTDPRVASRTT